MKSKRRHELQTNELADRLGQWIARVRPYSTLLCVAVLGVVLILAGWYYVAASRSQVLAAAWRSVMSAGANPQSDMVEELSRVADQYENSSAGLWAALTAADLEGARGMSLLFSDRAGAETSLGQAKSRYREVSANPRAAQEPLLLQRARFGLAQVCEGLSELEEAAKQYALVSSAAPGTTLGGVAQERVKQLENPEAKKWYHWFANQRPVPRNLGADRPPGQFPALPAEDLDAVRDSPGPDFLQGLGIDPGSSSAPATPSAPPDTSTAPPAGGTGAETPAPANAAPSPSPAAPPATENATPPAPAAPPATENATPPAPAAPPATEDAAPPASDVPPSDAPQ